MTKPKQNNSFKSAVVHEFHHDSSSPVENRYSTNSEKSESGRLFKMTKIENKFLRGHFRAIGKAQTLSETKMDESMIFEFYLRVDVLIRNEGITSACSLLKDLYRGYLRSLENSTGQVCIETSRWMSRNKLGQPSFMKGLNHFWNGNKGNSRRIILSILRCHEALTAPVNNDIQNIIQPSDGGMVWDKEYSVLFNRFLNCTFMRKKRLGFQRIWIQTQFNYKREAGDNPGGYQSPYFTAKKGPKSGVLALDQANSDLKNLRDNYNSLLKDLLIVANDFHFDDSFDKLILQTEDHSSDRERRRKKANEIPPCLGRIGFTPNPSGKTRVYAISNLYIQNGLKPLHDSLMQMLKSLKNDGTYDQDSACRIVQKWTIDKPVWSYDLTAATDRFPVEPQRDLISWIFGEDLANAWMRIMRNHDFITPDGSKVRYQVGQPMGVYSSWPAFSLTHHLLVQFCFWLAQQRPEKDDVGYVVLGDDYSCNNRKVNEFYFKIMTDLSVKINKTKSFIPPDDYKKGQPSMAEFAKRQFYKGSEISGIPGNMLIEYTNRTITIPLLLAKMQQLEIVKSRSLPIRTFIHNFLPGQGRKMINEFLVYLRFAEANLKMDPFDWASRDSSLDSRELTALVGRNPRELLLLILLNKIRNILTQTNLSIPLVEEQTELLSEQSAVNSMFHLVHNTVVNRVLRKVYTYVDSDYDPNKDSEELQQFWIDGEITETLLAEPNQKTLDLIQEMMESFFLDCPVQGDITGRSMFSYLAEHAVSDSLILEDIDLIPSDFITLKVLTQDIKSRPVKVVTYIYETVRNILKSNPTRKQ